MTTPAKKYQNVSYQELISYSENNPNRHRTLESIEVHRPTQENSLNPLGLIGYRSTDVNPANILSILVCLQDPNDYHLAPNHSRIQQLINLTTKLQERTEELKNTSLMRKRKKIHDLIAAAYNGTAFQEKDYLDLYQGVAHLTNQHFILIKEAVHDQIENEKQYDSALKGEVIFSSDPTTWKKENAVWVADYRGRWVAIPTEMNSSPLLTILPAWLTTMEQTGWIVQWPESDLTKKELVERLSILPTWKETDHKLVKDVLSVRLGRAMVIQTFSKWM
jgi:hypothetical protein